MPSLCALRPQNLAQSPWADPRAGKLLREGGAVPTTLSVSTHVPGLSSPSTEKPGRGRGAASGRALGATSRRQEEIGGAGGPRVKRPPEMKGGAAPAPRGLPPAQQVRQTALAAQVRGPWTGSSRGSPTGQQGLSCIVTGRPGDRTPAEVHRGMDWVSSVPARPGGLDAREGAAVWAWAGAQAPRTLWPPSAALIALSQDRCVSPHLVLAGPFQGFTGEGFRRWAL